MCSACNKKMVLGSSTKAQSVSNPNEVSTGSKDSSPPKSYPKKRNREPSPWMPVPGLVLHYSRARSVTKTFVATSSDFYYYNCGGEVDRGWGCTYRVLQMMVSNIKYTVEKRCRERSSGGSRRTVEIPTLRSIQTSLSEEKRLFTRSIVGTKEWLEPKHAVAYLTKHFGDHVSAKEYRVVMNDGDRKQSDEADNSFCSEEEDRDSNETSSCVGINDFDALMRALFYHFQTSKTPVMIDNHVQTKCVMGIGACSKTGEPLLLVFDPHIWSNKPIPWDKGLYRPAHHAELRQDEPCEGRKWVRWQSAHHLLTGVKEGKDWMLC
eukprot:CAMPEP_0114530506 /NCGR_PEP_ID=MMETSP0109-20121206/25486_1 /TAXON_ID=29199 /ORGANISM="Chlorarachnion reptans, Strain CCCM449" /LENGTH=320 /DNA_ID=CAMNT_0001713143 /DNA_START=387 /DNA_END=1346 /DNA_ORIENTATION=-